MNPKFLNYNFINLEEDEEPSIYSVKVNLAVKGTSKVLTEEDLQRTILTLFNNKICVEGIEGIAYLEFIEATVEKGAVNNG